MVAYKPILLNLLKQLLMLFVVYQICRLLFYAFNYSSYKDLSFTGLLGLCFYGLRFDAFSIASSNFIYIVLYLLPFKFHYHKIYQQVLLLIFMLSNAIAISLNFIDMAYFPFTQKRTTYDISGLIFGGQSEFVKLIPHFIAGYWYVILAYIACMYGIYRAYKHIRKKDILQKTEVNFKTITLHTFIFLLGALLSVVGIRGGIQKVPIVIMDAANYTSPKYIPVLINTPFSFLKSLDLNELKANNTYDEATLKKIYSPLHAPDTGKFNQQNVCILILESFSKEYTAIGKRTSYTPFLDSMMDQSTLFTNAYANGKSSIDGIPAIIAGIPTFLEDKYLNSRYSNNTLESLPNLLKEKNYYSAFFHGGTNGTMNFNSFASVAGFDLYYGRTEYNDETDYDGQWGIFDEPFLKRTVKEMSSFKQPFLSAIFTLTSHNPYKIPDAYKGKFPKGTLEIHESIGYTDYALRQFFTEAQKQNWFKNTLFVLVADHTGYSDDRFYTTMIGQYSIPITLYQYGQTPQKITYPVQQIDILPTVLDHLNYDKPYYAFGKSMLTHSNQPVIYYTSPTYHCLKDSLYFVLSDNKFIYALDYPKDSVLETDVIKKVNYKPIETFCKAYVQTYTNDVINNKTHYHINK